MEILFEMAGELQVLRVDATLNELHDGSSIVTEHAVESGVALSDHVRHEPERLSLEVHVSNSPIRPPPEDGFTPAGSVSALNLEVGAVEGGGGLRRLRNGATAGPSGVTPAVWDRTVITRNASVLQFPGGLSRVELTWETLRQIRLQAIKVTVTTNLRQYDDMVISNVSTPRNAVEGDGATITVELRTIKTATTQTVSTPEPLETRAERTRRRGAQTAEEVPEEQTENRSFAAALLEDYGGLGLMHHPERNGQGIFTR